LGGVCFSSFFLSTRTTGIAGALALILEVVIGWELGAIVWVGSVASSDNASRK